MRVIPLHAWEDPEDSIGTGTALDWAEKRVEEQQQAREPVWGRSSGSVESGSAKEGLVIDLIGTPERGEKESQLVKKKEKEEEGKLTVGQLAGEYLKGQLCVSSYNYLDSPHVTDISLSVSQIDARYFGNVGSFMRRREKGATRLLTRRHVFNNANDLRIPRLALFATRNIPAGTELVI